MSKKSASIKHYSEGSGELTMVLLALSSVTHNGDCVCQNQATWDYFLTLRQHERSDSRACASPLSHFFVHVCSHYFLKLLTFVVGNKQFCLFVWSLLFCLCLLWLLAPCLAPTMTGFLCSQRCFNLLLLDMLLFII
jgi:hypothetical protein